MTFRFTFFAAVRIVFGLLLLTSCALHGQINFAVFDEPARPSEAHRTDLMRTLGRMPSGVPLNLDTLEVVALPGGKRLLIQYQAELPDTLFGTPGDTIQAYLFVPDDLAVRRPAIVAIHQDGPNDHIGKREVAGIIGDSTLFYGRELFERGYVVICPDRYTHAYRRRLANSGEKHEDSDEVNEAESHWLGQLIMRGRTNTGKEVYDLTRAVDVLHTYDFVDTTRIGAIGHSGGGYNMVYFVAYDRRVAAAVSSCGFFELTYWFHEAAAKKRGSSAALPGLLNVGIGTDFLIYIAPRPVLLTRGLYEWGDTGKWAKFSQLDVEEYKHIEQYVQPVYDQLGATDQFKVIYFDEEGGRHAMPPNLKKTIYAWLDAHLK